MYGNCYIGYLYYLLRNSSACTTFNTYWHRVIFRCCSSLISSCCSRSCCITWFAMRWTLYRPCRCRWCCFMRTTGAGWCSTIVGKCTCYRNRPQNGAFTIFVISCFCFCDWFRCPTNAWDNLFINITYYSFNIITVVKKFNINYRVVLRCSTYW